ncbi:unnamed protein product [Diamesa hyperborea]
MAARTMYLILIVVMIACLIQSALAAPQEAVNTTQEAVTTTQAVVTTTQAVVTAAQDVVTAGPAPTTQAPPGILESFRDFMGSIFTKFATVL